MPSSTLSNLSHTIHLVSGSSAHDCAFIGFRFEGDDFRPETSESWVMQEKDATVKTLTCWRTWLTGVWRSETGAIYASDAIFDRVIVYPQAMSGDKTFQRFPLDASMQGIWGLDDTHVWSWGTRSGTPVLFYWDGQAWTEIASPGEILSLHGTDADHLYAVGIGGFIARWDGKTWTKELSPTTRALRCVFVVDKNEVWACSLQGELLQRVDGIWNVILEHAPGILCLAKWKDVLWVGANRPMGLAKLEKGKLISVKKTLFASSMDARHDLLLAYRDGLSSTHDGKTFADVSIEAFVERANNLTPAWRL